MGDGRWARTHVYDRVELFVLHAVLQQITHRIPCVHTHCKGSMGQQLAQRDRMAAVMRRRTDSLSPNRHRRVSPLE